MKRAPVKDGKIIADLHCHPTNKGNNKKTLEMLCAPGLIGLTFFTNDPKLLTYEEVLRRFPEITNEIDTGFLTNIEFEGKKGYVARTQEVIGGRFHILAVGFEGEYFPDFEDPRKVVEAIHKRKGLAILNHPHLTYDGRFRLINDEEEKTAEELCSMVDEVEIFNAHCINPTFGLLIPNMKRVNEKAEELAKRSGFKGIVSTDTHYGLDQPKVCGIYIEEENLCIEKLKNDVKKGNFENDYRKYISRLSFFNGVVLNEILYPTR